MCTDTDTTRDMDTFILIRLCSDLCHTVGVNGWACLLFLSLLVQFLPFFPAGGKSMLKINKITKEEMEQYSNASFISMTAFSCVVYTKEKLEALLLP